MNRQSQASRKEDPDQLVSGDAGSTRVPSRRPMRSGGLTAMAPQTALVADRAVSETANATRVRQIESVPLGRADSAPLAHRHRMTTVYRRPSIDYIVEPFRIAASDLVERFRSYGFAIVPTRLPWQRRGSLLSLHEGRITTRQLIEAAAEFDALDDDIWSAAEFVAWLIPDVEGSPEERWLWTHRSERR